MPKQHTVKQGESLSLIAKAYGFSDYRSIYDSNLNEAFRKDRPNPNAIQPGDVLTIPDKELAPAKVPPSAGMQKVEDRWILLAVDGTLSETYQSGAREEPNQSAVKRFYDDFKGVKEYRNGPGISGSNIRNIPLPSVFVPQRAVLQLAANLVCGKVDPSHLPNPDQQNDVQAAVCRGVSEIADSAEKWLFKAIADNPGAKICIIGHSRGATIATQIAASLNRAEVTVEFLGLYDAVDMAMGTKADYIPLNVKKAAHAMRHPDLGSRNGWGNSSRASTESHLEKKFTATHGSIGGAKRHACPVGKFSFVTKNDGCHSLLSESANMGKGREADSWIREAAKSVNVPLK